MMMMGYKAEFVQSGSIQTDATSNKRYAISYRLWIHTKAVKRMVCETVIELSDNGYRMF
jgi:hypothetical protein